ncbi:MAG: V-type ATP synthase subunit E family protein [Halobacteriota archaeon]
MGLEVVVNDVLAKGESEAQQIKREGQEGADSIIAQAERDAQALLVEMRDQMIDQIERRKRREEASAHLEVKRLILNAKKQLLDELYVEAIKALARLPESEREEIIQNLLKSPEGFTRVYSNAQDEPLVRRNSTLQYGGTISCTGGVLLENEDGTIIRDLTFDAMLDDVREGSIKKVAEILFE